METENCVLSIFWLRGYTCWKQLHHFTTCHLTIDQNPSTCPREMAFVKIAILSISTS